MQQMIKYEKFSRRMRSHLYLVSNDFDPVHDLIVELVIFAHRVVHAITPFDQPRQDVIDITDWKRIIDS